jgi:hypothetical protein
MNSRSLSPLPAVALAGITALLLAACGGGAKPPAATASGQSPQDGARDAYRFSACMRTHGVTNFQDPHVHTNGNQVQVAIHVDPAITGSPSFKSAQHACSHLLPNGGNAPTQAQQHARARAILAFAKCMRGRGFPKFPDPDSQGRLTPAMLSQAGIDLHQPAIRPAAYACLPMTHGLVTKADINRAVANPSGAGPQSGG